MFLHFVSYKLIEKPVAVDEPWNVGKTDYYFTNCFKARNKCQYAISRVIIILLPRLFYAYPFSALRCNGYLLPVQSLVCLRRSLMTSCTAKIRCTKSEKPSLLLPYKHCSLRSWNHYFIKSFCYYTLFKRSKNIIYLLRILNNALHEIRKTCRIISRI